MRRIIKLNSKNASLHYFEPPFLYHCVYSVSLSNCTKPRLKTLPDPTVKKIEGVMILDQTLLSELYLGSLSCSLSESKSYSIIFDNRTREFLKTFEEFLLTRRSVSKCQYCTVGSWIKADTTLRLYLVLFPRVYIVLHPRITRELLNSKNFRDQLSSRRCTVRVSTKQLLDRFWSKIRS